MTQSKGQVDCYSRVVESTNEITIAGTRVRMVSKARLAKVKACRNRDGPCTRSTAIHSHLWGAHHRAWRRSRASAVCFTHCGGVAGLSGLPGQTDGAR